MARGSSVLLASGGMDSMMMWRLLGQPPILFCDIGQKYRRTERAALWTWGIPIESTRLRLGDLEQRDGHIPFRNLVFAVLAAIEGYDTIYLGALAGESSRDKSGRFFRDTSRLLSYCENKRVKVVAPFRHKTKTELVQTYLKLGKTTKPMKPGTIRRVVTRETLVEDLLATRSCYTGRYPGCGACMACFRRWVALFLNGIAEQYEHHPWEWHLATSFTWRDALRGLRSVPVAEWLAVARNNRQALKALHMARNPLPMPSQ